MDRDAALADLPEPYRRALSLRDGGGSDAEIAAALEIEPEAVATLLDVAREKLARRLSGP